MNPDIRSCVGTVRPFLSANRASHFLMVIALLIATAHHLPAPIQEIPEAPTPAPEQSAKPKPKRTIKSKATSESSEASTKRQTLSPQPQSKAAPSQNSFDRTRTTDDVRTITVNPDGSRTAYEFDRAHHKATA